jgi:hypothetical protein
MKTDNLFTVERLWLWAVIRNGRMGDRVDYSTLSNTRRGTIEIMADKVDPRRKTGETPKSIWLNWKKGRCVRIEKVLVTIERP